MQALQEAGIAYDPDKVVWFYTEDRKTHPYEQMYHMAKTRCVHFFDSVVSYNDQIALEVIRALEDAGLKVPEDVSVTGYDDSYLASSGKVPLTTVAHPQEKLGEMAAELLLGLLKHPGVRKTDPCKAGVSDPGILQIPEKGGIKDELCADQTLFY